MTSRQTKSVMKAGKTLLVKSIKDDYDLDKLDLDQLKGLISQNMSNSSNTKFLVFDKVEFASSAYFSLKGNENYHKKFALKYPKYNIFFKLNGLTDTMSYDYIKKTHINFITANTNAQVLYYKLYKKDNKYMGCGEMVLDLKDAVDSLLNKELELKNFKLDDTVSGSFYKFKKSDKMHERTEPQCDVV